MAASSQPRISRARDLLPLIFYGGVLLGAAECMYHHFGVPPLGPLRFGGASWIVFMALQGVLFTLPGLIGIFLLRLVRGLGWSTPAEGASGRNSERAAAAAGERVPSKTAALTTALIWFVAVLPTVWVDLDHLARFSHWPWMRYHQPGIFVVQVALLTLVLSGVAAAILWRPSQWCLRILGGRSGRTIQRVMTLLALGLVFAGAWQLRLPTAVPGYSRVSPRAPNILLFTVDTLRRDALGAYGGEATPGFDAWIAQGVRADGWSCSPWTRPTFASLFSAVAPTGHGADKHRPVSPEVNWWPEILRQNGYVTRAWVCNPHLEASLGFARGFSRFNHASHLEILEPAAQMLWVRWLHRRLQEHLDRGDRIIHRAQRWFRRKPRGPWMVWVHVLDPHMPYHLRGPHGEVSDPHPGTWLDPLKPYLDHGAVRDVRAIREAGPELSAGAKSALAELYRREILFLDRQVLGLLESAQAASGDRPLLWVLASDHGEEFFEHGGFEHGHTLYGELLRVPLAFGGLDLPRHARVPGMKIEDIGPTVLSLAGLPPMGLRGRAVSAVDSILAPYVFGEDRSGLLGHATALAEGAAEKNPGECDPPRLLAEDLLYGTQRTRFIFEDGSGVWRDDQKLKFARIDACPPQEEHLIPVNPQQLPAHVRALFESLDRWRAAAAKIPHAAIEDPALRARLRSLGYVE